MGNYDGFGTYNFGGGGGGGGSAGTSNQFQITDNAGGFLASILQETGGQIGAGGVTVSAVFSLSSITDRGFIMPSMTSVQQGAIVTPATGLEIYNTDVDAPMYNHSVDGWIPTGRYAGANVGSSNGIVQTSNPNGLLVGGNLRANSTAVIPINQGTGAVSNQTISLGSSLYRFLNTHSKDFTAYGGGNGYGFDGTGGYKISAFLSQGITFRDNLGYVANLSNSASTKGLNIYDSSPATAITIDASAILELQSTTRGFLPPRMTVAQQTAITTPATGLQVHVEDATDSIPYYNHSVDGWIPVGRYANKGATVNGGIAPTGNTHLVSSNVDGEINYSPFRWSVSGVTPYLYGVRTDTNAVSSADLGASSTNVRWLNLYFRGTLNHRYGNLTWTTGTNAGMAIKSTGDLRIGFTGTGSQAGMILRDDAVETYDIDASAMIELRSTTRGFLPPKMTTVQMNAVGTPATGLMIYDTTTNQWMGYDGTSWVIIG